MWFSPQKWEGFYTHQRSYIHPNLVLQEIGLQRVLNSNPFSMLKNQKISWRSARALTRSSQSRRQPWRSHGLSERPPITASGPLSLPHCVSWSLGSLVDVCIPNSCFKSSRMPKALLHTHRDGYCQKPTKQTKSKEQVLVRMRRKWNTWGPLAGTSRWHSHSGIQDGGSSQLGRRLKELKQDFSQYL